MKVLFWVFAILLVSGIAAAVPNAVPTERISGSHLFFEAFSLTLNGFVLSCSVLLLVILILISDAVLGLF